MDNNYGMMYQDEYMEPWMGEMMYGWPGTHMGNPCNPCMPGMGMEMPWSGGMMPEYDNCWCQNQNCNWNEMADLPEEAKEALKDLMALDFALIDLNLYLTTHPCDQQALAQYRNYVRMRQPLINEVQELYGPLTPVDAKESPWSWLNRPWPWRINF